jgi:phosphomannomutase/phosphoglucomutase
MHIKPTIFREYDIRGIAMDNDPARVDITEEVMERIAMGYAAYLKGKRKHNLVLLGRDGRVTGKRLAQAAMDGLTACGLNVIDLGQIPTGVLYYALNTLKVDGGLMLTASHNPKEYNGVKVGVGNTTIFGEDIQKLREKVEAGKFPKAKGPVTITRLDIVPKYQKRIAKIIRLKRKLRVVVDAGNGVGGVVAVPLYEKLGCEVIPLYCEVDGNFPNHHPDPTKPRNLEALIAAVKEHKADLGIAFDGDVDRIGGCDEQGNILWGDRLLALFAQHILKDKKGATIIGEVKCSRSLYEHVKKHGGKAVMWRTGHSHIKAAMKKLHAQVAGEMSGHIFFKHRWYGFDDAIYAGARLLEIVASGKKPLSAHLAAIPTRFNTPELEFHCADDRKFEVVKQATEFFKAQGLDVVTIDGARVEFKDGWGLLRASNTSPNLVVRVEADTAERMEEIRAMIEAKVRELTG